MNRVGLTALALASVAAIAATVAFPARADAQRRSPQGAADRSARGTPGVPLTTVLLSLGRAHYDARVDAHCHVDDRAAPGNTRAYFVVMYPWFGQRPPTDQPQWQLNLEIRRGARADTHDEFTFSFQDGQKSGVIQTVDGSQRIGSGTVRASLRGRGARFEVEGRSSQGEAIRATIECSSVQKNEGVSG